MIKQTSNAKVGAIINTVEKMQGQIEKLTIFKSSHTQKETVQRCVFSNS